MIEAQAPWKADPLVRLLEDRNLKIRSAALRLVRQAHRGQAHPSTPSE